ncbi:MAG: nucleoside-diphosphate sugar epimerase/dehydratase [Acidobacteriota bacterium]
MSKLLNRRYFIFMLVNMILCAGSLWVAFLLRFDYSIPTDQYPLLLAGLALSVPVKLIIFQFLRLNSGGWRYTGIADLLRLVAANGLACLLFTMMGLMIIGPSFPRSVYGIDLLLSFLLTAAARCGVRVFYEMKPRSGFKGKNTLIYGAGAAGAGLAREIRANPDLGYKVIGFLDDNLWKKDIRICGSPILGTGKEASRIIAQYRAKKLVIEEIIIAMPSADSQQLSEALEHCRAAGVACKKIPGIADVLTGKTLTSDIRDITLTDLLGREPVHIEEDRIREQVFGRSVLVSGAAGSIGSELCRQIASFGPVKLVALDQAESDLFKIDNELRAKFPNQPVIAEIGDIRNKERMLEVIRKHGITSIFHAAAYKHVPLMEAHPAEAIRNNVIGTWNLVQAAYEMKVGTFLMISSDKAVNPSSVMGATKRVSELMLLSMPHNRTRFVSVRFGNVLGSNGSVIPLFQAQIAAGGPLTVTHPDMTRYFMTIPEAVQLVLLASTMGKGGEVFVLDMGSPVKIVDLARQMIRLAGRIPDDEIEIRFTGMRPGEKLYEELNSEGENILPTEHEKIRIFQSPGVDADNMRRWFAELERLLGTRDDEATVAHLKGLIREYQGSSRQYATAHSS